MDWLTVVAASRHWRRLFAVHRDPDGFARLAAVARNVVRVQAGHRALNQVGVILAAKGGMVSDITVGDCLELREAERRTRSEGAHSRSLFYDLLRELGNFPPDAPPTLRHWNRMAGQVSVAQLVDRYALQCRPVRDHPRPPGHQHHHGPGPPPSASASPPTVTSPHAATLPGNLP